MTDKYTCIFHANVHVACADEEDNVEVDVDDDIDDVEEEDEDGDELSILLLFADCDISKLPDEAVVEVAAAADIAVLILSPLFPIAAAAEGVEVKLFEVELLSPQGLAII